MNANDRQVGGTHYKSQSIQPWDFVAANGLGFFEGNIIKYVARHHLKGGVEDLQKARHYLDKLIELLDVPEEFARESHSAEVVLQQELSTAPTRVESPLRGVFTLHPPVRDEPGS